MEKRGFRKLEADHTVKGDSYSVLWETPGGKTKLTPLKDRGNLEKIHGPGQWIGAFGGKS
ncbi:MAG: hypothetical protein Q9N34_00600 [Aquificota bacterium]|nr:hypothetical protein [Aquificota bacterium]